MMMKILLAGRPAQTTLWLPIFENLPGYAVSVATHPAAWQAQLPHNDLALLDSLLFATPAKMVAALQSVTQPVHILLPPVHESQFAQIEAQLAELPAVRSIFRSPITASELRAALPTPEPVVDTIPLTPSPTPLLPPAPLVVSVWNQAGGVGKTTISTNLAYALSTQGFKTLLIGLGACDDLPLILGLRAAPNITNWRANPTSSGLNAALQKRGPLDVLAGFPDVYGVSAAIEGGNNGVAAIPNLILQAGRLGYAFIIIDTPQDDLAAQTIPQADRLVLVARPSLEGAHRAAAAYQLVSQRLNGHFGAKSIYVVLNGLHPRHRLSIADWQRAASERLGETFPDVTAGIPHDTRVGNAQDQRAIPFEQVRPFSTALRPLLAALLRAAGGQEQPQVSRFGPIRVIR